MANFLKNEVLEKMASDMKQSRGTCQRRLNIMDILKNFRTNYWKTCILSTFFCTLNRKICDILVFMDKNRVKKENFSKFSTGEIPVSTGPVNVLNLSVTGPAGPVPALDRTGSISDFDPQTLQTLPWKRHRHD